MLLLTDQQWAFVAPLLPRHRPSRRGGRPRCDDRACLEGILWILRTGARWRDLPERYPSASTCWRRLAEWEAEDRWRRIWRAVLGQLDQRGLIDWEECFLDGTFASAKKGGSPSGPLVRGRARSSWYWSSVRVFLSEFASTLPRGPRSRSPKRRSSRSPSRARGRAGRG